MGLRAKIKGSAFSLTTGRHMKESPGTRRNIRPRTHDALANALRKLRTMMWFTFSLFSGERRNAASWGGASGGALDFDFRKNGEHAAVPKRIAQAVLDAAKAGLLPDGVLYMTERGLRFCVLFIRVPDLIEGASCRFEVSPLNMSFHEQQRCCQRFRTGEGPVCHDLFQCGHRGVEFAPQISGHTQFVLDQCVIGILLRAEREVPGSHLWHSLFHKGVAQVVECLGISGVRGEGREKGGLCFRPQLCGNPGCLL